MTTIAYDGKTLAADTRVTLSHSHKSFECVACGDKRERVRNNQVKLKSNFKGKSYNGEMLIAAGGAGTVGKTDILFNILESNIDLDMAMEALAAFSANGNMEGATMLIVTDKYLYKLSFSDQTSNVYKFPLETKIAIGSGRLVAEASMNMFSADAIQAVRVTMEVDNATGGGINYVDCNLGPNQEIKASDKIDLMDLKVLLSKKMLDEAEKHQAEKTKLQEAMKAASEKAAAEEKAAAAEKAVVGTSETPAPAPTPVKVKAVQKRLSSLNKFKAPVKDLGVRKEK